MPGPKFRNCSASLHGEPDQLGQAFIEIWEDAERAMQSLAIRRGMPHESLADLKRAVRSAAIDSPDRRVGIIAGLQSALSFHDNIEDRYMDESDLEYFAPGVREFVDELDRL